MNYWNKVFKGRYLKEEGCLGIGHTEPKQPEFLL